MSPLAARRTRLAALAVGLLALGCMQGSIWIEEPPEPADPVVPSPLERTSPPELVASGMEGILVARDVSAPLYFDQGTELWYRYWRGRWYQAFSWNGAWFTPERVPPDLRQSREKPAPNAVSSPPTP